MGSGTGVWLDGRADNADILIYVDVTALQLLVCLGYSRDGLVADRDNIVIYAG